MIRHTGFITTERAHLVEIARRVALSLPLELFPDPQTPLTIAVNGTFIGGKKIFPDYGVEALLGENATMQGDKEYDEMHTGSYQGRPLQVSFMNVAWGGGYSDPAYDRIYKVRNMIKYFHGKRAEAGISYLHNMNKSDTANCDISLWLESPFGAIVDAEGNWMPTPRRMTSQAPELNDHFKEATKNNGWVRWMEIKINNRKLAKHPQIQAMMGELHHPHNIAKLTPTWTEKIFTNAVWLPKRTGVIPQYGVNIPQDQTGNLTASPQMI